MTERDSRLKREAEIYDDEKLERDVYDSVLEFSTYGPARLRREAFTKSVMSHDIKNKKILEIGSQSWQTMICKHGLQPGALTCINISKTELEKGARLAKKKNFNADFKLMDAHKLEFNDETFDLVYGVAILHHLELDAALKEIHRVLKTDGKILFVEPLNINPISKLVRFLTPKARTPDEKPFTIDEINLLNNYFELSNLYTEFLSVPASIISKLFYKTPNNPITRLADKFDEKIAAISGYFGMLHRTVTVYGNKRLTKKN